MRGNFAHRPPSCAGSVSFGAPRDFLLRHNAERGRKLRFPLGGGDVLIMSGATQARNNFLLLLSLV